MEQVTSPLLAGIPISSRFAEKLGIAQKKQDQQQMTHTQSSTQDDKSWDQNLYEKSDIYRSIKDAYTAPMRAWEGNIDPYSDQGVLEALNLAGVGLAGSIPGGSTGPGTMNLIRGQKIFRFTSTGGTENIPGLGKVLREITPDLKGISRRFADPAEEFGTHVSVDRSAPEHISRELRGFVDENGMLTMASKVEKPYWVEDTGSTWNPDQVVNVLTNRVGPTLDKMSLKDKGRLSKKAIETLYKIQRDYKNYKEAWNKENGILSSITEPGMTQEDYVAALDTKYNKQIQEILKKEGFDHISYINTREGNPVESAILFNREDVELLQAGKKKITPPSKREGLNEISSPIQEPKASIKEQLKQLDSTYLKGGVKKTTEADPLLIAVEKLAGMIEGMNKPKTVIRDKDGRITGVA